MKQSCTYTKIAAAVAVALAGSAVSVPASAVNLSDNGLGEVILSPYYTVRNGYDTYLSVVNTSQDRVVAFKIRFRESDNSRDARDFNVFLSPNDVWTAAVTMSADGQTPVVQTSDNSCTAPALRAADATTDGMRGVTFTNLDYSGGAADTGDAGIERAQDGHFEIIAMGSAPVDRPLAAAAVHDANGVPANCNLIISTYTTNAVAFNDQYDEPLNVLKGAAALIKVDEGKATGIPITTLANFFNPLGVDDQVNPDPADLMNLPASIAPNLNNASPAIASLVTNEFGPMLVAFPDRPIDAVSAIFMASDVINEYAIGGAALAENDWVVTFPTKNFYVDTREDGVPPVRPPFQNTWQGDLDGDGRSCVTVAYDYYNREERSPAFTPDLDFSPAPPGVPPSSVCEETIVLSFAENSVLEGNNRYGVPLADGFTSGWMRLSFTEAGAISGPSVVVNPITGQAVEGNATFTGLPVIGFGLKTLENGVADVDGARLNYGIQSDHAYNRDIQFIEALLP